MVILQNFTSHFRWLMQFWWVRHISALSAGSIIFSVVPLPVRPTIAQVRPERLLSFSGECLAGMNWNLACWCILTKYRLDWNLVMVYSFYPFWNNFDSVKRAEFGVSLHLLGNARNAWPEIWHAKVIWPPSELIILWSRSLDLPIRGQLWHSGTGQLLVFWAFSGERMEGMTR